MADNRETAHSVLGILGNVASCLFFLSSAPRIVRMVRLKSCGGLSGDLYVFKLFNCLMWAFYGLPFVHPHDFWVVLTNSFGCAFASMYIISHLLYASKPEQISLIWKLFAIIAGFVSMVVLLFLLDRSQTSRILIVGILCAVISSCMHITLLSQCTMVLESKDVKYLQPNSSITAFLKGAIWTTYGIVDFDIFIIIPNGVGVLIGMIQMVVVVVLLCKERQEVPELSGGSHDGSAWRMNSVYPRLEGALNNTVFEPSSSKSVSHVSPVLGLPRQSSTVVPMSENDVCHVVTIP